MCVCVCFFFFFSGVFLGFLVFFKVFRVFSGGFLGFLGFFWDKTQLAWFAVSQSVSY